MPTSRPSIDEILTTFFARERAAASGTRSQRVDRVEATLRRCLEVDCDRVLDDRGLSLLHVERIFEPAGAFARSMRADDLAFALLVFLEDRWLAADPSDRRLQVRMALRIVDFLLERRLIDERDLACPLVELKVQASRIRAQLRTELGARA
jgi:hypothetical protein